MYLHRIQDCFFKIAFEKSQQELNRLIRNYGDDSHVYTDTIISPSYTYAIVQSIQISNILSMENNMIVLEYDKENPDELVDIIDKFKLINSGNVDVFILASS